MKCPYCEGTAHVVDTREAAGVIRRRRHCDGCKKRFTTYERVALASLQVVKSDGRREDFDREKLLRGLRIACVKRPVSADTLDRIANEIENSLQQGGRSEIPSKQVGEMVMDRLRVLDDVAYVRFASVYRRFTDLVVLAEEISRLREQKDREEEHKRQLPLDLSQPDR